MWSRTVRIGDTSSTKFVITSVAAICTLMLGWVKRSKTGCAIPWSIKLVRKTLTDLESDLVTLHAATRTASGLPALAAAEVAKVDCEGVSIVALLNGTSESIMSGAQPISMMSFLKLS